MSKITHSVLYASNFGKLLAFYRDVIGFKVSAEQEDFAEFETKEVTLALLGPSVVKQLLGDDAEKSAGERARSHLSLSVEDVDVAYNTLKEKGANFLKPPKTQPWGQRTAFLSDPEDNLWEVYSWVETGD